MIEVDVADVVKEENFRGKTIDFWQKTIRAWANSKNFNWDVEPCSECGRSDVDTLVVRLHSEVTEVGEGARDGNDENIREELADIFIRLVDTCEVMGVDLEEEVIKKHFVNMGRPILHGRGRK